MALYLVQHGKARSSKEGPEKGLSEQGVEETRRIAGVAEGYRVQVGIIRHSGKARAEQTAAIMKAYLKPSRGIEMTGGIGPMDDPEAFIKSIDVNDNMMVVSHLPFLERFVTLLTTGSPGKKVFKFQNSGIVCLDRDSEGWFIKWTLMPGIR